LYASTSIEGLRDMDIVSLLIQGILAAFTGATLVAVIVYTQKTSEMTAATRKVAEIAQLQRLDQYRPLLVPTEAPMFQNERPNQLAWSKPRQEFTIRNIGPGAALNVAAVLYGCESYLVGELGQQKRINDTKDTHWTAWSGEPIASNGTAVIGCKIGAGVFFENNKQIGIYHFNAQPEPNAGEAMSGRTPFRLARIIITATDPLGQKHASIFDYEQHTQGWRLVEFIPNIERDLHDLEGQSHSE
jgi:hypothetical protein